MLEAIAGDIIGSIYEFSPAEDLNFPLFSRKSHFTDDTVLTCAVAESLRKGVPYDETYRRYFHMYPDANYGEMFRRWAANPNEGPYRSFGNGSAMRISPVGWAFHSLEDTLSEAKRSAMPTHNHSEAIAGAQSVAGSIYLARSGYGKQVMREFVEERFGYDLSEPIDVIRGWYAFDESCMGTVPVAIRAFLESENWEHAVRLAVWVGGDADTLACIAGAIAEAFYGRVPQEAASATMERLDPFLLDMVETFRAGIHRNHCGASQFMSSA